MVDDLLVLEQWQWLQECLDDHKNTLYGQKYDFASISSAKQYQEEVPLVSYQDIEIYMEMISRGEKDVLFCGLPFAFEMTGGSTAGAKLIPYTQKSFRDFQRAILPYIESTFQTYQINPANSYWAISPAIRSIQYTASGVPIGVSDSEYLGIKGETHALMPGWIATLKEMKQWKLATLYYLIVAENLEFISIWSPTFLLVLLESMNEFHQELIDFFKNSGEISGHYMPVNGNALARFLHYMETHETRDLWPNMKLISLWQDGTSLPYAKKLKKAFSTVAFESKGLLSTEGIVSIPNKGFPVLTEKSGFYEFRTDDGEVLFSHQLKNGNAYEVILTTNGGLYRYCTGDIVSCEGYMNKKPILKFSNRKGIVSDMVGEKLTENFVFNVLKDVDGFSMLIPHLDILAYSLVIEKSSKVSQKNIEKKLFENPQYRYARELGQLGELKIVKMQNPMKVYIDRMISEGKRIGDIKIPSLSNNDRWLK